MRGPQFDQRLGVHAGWDGTPDNSVSRAYRYAGGPQVAVNLAPRPRAVGGFSPNSNVYKIDQDVPVPGGHPAGNTRGSRLYRTPGVGGTTVTSIYNLGGLSSAGWAGKHGGMWVYSTVDLPSSTFLGVPLGLIPAGRWVWTGMVERTVGSTFTSDAGTEASADGASIYLAGILADTGPWPGIYFDGDTHAPWTLFQLSTSTPPRCRRLTAADLVVCA